MTVIDNIVDRRPLSHETMMELGFEFMDWNEDDYHYVFPIKEPNKRLVVYLTKGGFGMELLGAYLYSGLGDEASYGFNVLVETVDDVYKLTTALKIKK